jgi:hypothetical protein
MIDLGKITQGERGSKDIAWEFPVDVPASLVGATVTAVARNLDTGDVTTISGAITPTAATTARWALSEGDSGTPGTYALVFRAVVGDVATYTLPAVLEVVANPAATVAQNPPLVNVTADQAAWLAAARAQVPDGDDVATRDGDGTAGELATIDASGNAVRAGYGASIAPTGGSVVRRDGFGSIEVASTGSGQYPLRISDNGDYVSGIGRNGALEFVGVNAAINRATQRTLLGLGTIATQDANNVAITGGAISGITDLAIADGGTGASTPSGALQNLEPVVTATVAANYTINAASGSVFVLTLTGNHQLSFSNLAAGRVITVHIIQDGVGNRVPTWSGVTWGATGAPTLRTGANDRDKLSFDSYNGTIVDGHLIEQYDN